MRNSMTAAIAIAIVGAWWWWSEMPRNDNNRAVANNITSVPSQTRLKIQFEVTATEDLKIVEGQRVKKGQLIAEHRPQRITAPCAGSIARVKLLSRRSGLLKYEVVSTCSQPPTTNR
jgi:Na+-translocating ferredoxin:NAD+ oxidoreductase RnfC subunit